MTPCFFVSDLHGHVERYEKMFGLIRDELPVAVFMGGDLLPHRLRPQRFRGEEIGHFITGYLFPRFRQLRSELGQDYPAVFLIMGNDDPRSEEEHFFRGEELMLWHYIHMRSVSFRGYTVMGYGYIPPSPFQLKDWERYDVSKYVDPGNIPPTEGFRTWGDARDAEHATIRKHLGEMTGETDPARLVFLFHSPPYDTYLDRAALDGMVVEHVPLDVHVGSIAIKEFIEEKQPVITMHGHIHESSRLTGHWCQTIGCTMTFNAAWDGPELAVVKFELERPADAVRVLL
ncbi:MAG: metallophosphoesterase [Bacteroidales bacterium]|nr:metallophosphoesterase [Bacteroidales bacterium]